MKIIYYSNHHNKLSDNTEGHISKALVELGHEVVKVGPSEGYLPEGDLLLFHKLAPRYPFNGKKVCWYFDKVWNGRDLVIREFLKSCDKIFLTDETWVGKNYHPKLEVLRQGIGESKLGNPIKGVNAKIAFTGSLYGDRIEWIGNLAKEFNEDFQVFDGVHNEQFRDLCASVKIMVAPTYPSDDFYWSNRVYLTIGSGGFLLHPRLKGLEDEYKDGEEIVYYDSFSDLLEKIKYYLVHDKERERIRQQGWEKTRTLYTYKNRVRNLLERL